MASNSSSAVLFGDIEDAIVAWLAAALTPTPVRTRIPSGTNPPYVIVLRLGGSKVNHVAEEATLTVEAFGKSDAAAHDLAQDARLAMHELPGTTVNGLAFYKVDEFAAPGRLPDPISAKPRFVATYAVRVRASST